MSTTKFPFIVIIAASCIVGHEAARSSFILRNNTGLYHFRPSKRVEIVSHYDPVVIDYLGEKYVLPANNYVFKTTRTGATVERRPRKHIPTYEITPIPPVYLDFKSELMVEDKFVWTEREKELYRELTGMDTAREESGLIQWEFKGGFASYPLLTQ